MPAQPSRFVDNLDGTVTDHQTGLMWEKKEAGGSCLHCANDTYPWRDALSEWLSEVNGLVASADFQVGLGGHSDWRLASIGELDAIRDCMFGPACVDPTFGPTAASLYWSASSDADLRSSAWIVSFAGNLTGTADKTASAHVRAVRRIR